MELNDLKAGWQHAGAALKNETDLQKMTQVSNHPVLKKIRRKLIVETAGLAVFLLIYYDWFDGDQKPFTVNLFLVVSLLLYLSNNIIGYIAIASPVRRTNLKLSVQDYFIRIKRLSIASLVISFVYSVSLIIFFTSIINFTKEKRMILAGIVLVLLQLLLFSWRNWHRKINRLKQQTIHFNQG
ncbi:MAG TPA: hypothetical protein PLY34_11830 [Ferruginibacter sp.]|jgi:hypothetical protein|nr:hypothetical protein [Ferruginibacter sp.]HPH91865.1 hypothetical protein [Ferruginibacter sp.]